VGLGVFQVGGNLRTHAGEGINGTAVVKRAELKGGLRGTGPMHAGKLGGGLVFALCARGRV
jgi:hypothetical protein